MKYIALIYSGENDGPQPGTPEWGPFMAGYEAVGKAMHGDGNFVAGEALQPVSTATTVTVRNGKTETMDGPFAETKEQLGGFYMFEAPDLDKAIEYAALIPTAQYGRVEVRPIMSFD